MKDIASRMAPIGLYDSGVGGLSVMREVLRQLPGEAVHYLGDTARVPYGGREEAELITFNREILAYLASEGAKAILVACNTSCAVALDALRPESPVPVVGLIDAGARSAVAAGKRIAVLATEATVRSGAYERSIKALEPEATVISLACPELVPVVESGQWDGPEADRVVARALEPLAGTEIDAAVLGCTHYPLLASAIGRVLGPAVRLVDPAVQAVRELAGILKRLELLAGMPDPPMEVPGTAEVCVSRGSALALPHRFVVTANEEAFALQAARILGIPAPPVRRIFLETLRLAGDRLLEALLEKQRGATAA